MSGSCDRDGALRGSAVEWAAYAVPLVGVGVVDFQAEVVNVEDDKSVRGVLDGVALLCSESGYEESAECVVDFESC